MKTPSQLSYEAYQSIIDDLPDMRRKVYEYILSRGKQGATSEEVCIGISKPTGTIHGRTTELCRIGLIEQIGVRKTSSGRSAAVYAAREFKEDEDWFDVDLDSTTSIGGKLRYSEETGEGDVVLSKRFKSESPLMRADCLKDWLGLIQKLYQQSLDDMRSEFDDIRKED